MTPTTAFFLGMLLGLLGGMFIGLFIGGLCIVSSRKLPKPDAYYEEGNYGKEKE
jgi:hypothetical protein